MEVEVRASGAETGSVFTSGGTLETEGDLDPDHRLVLRSSLPLLKSRNSGVVLAVCALHYYCGSQNSATSSQIGKSLVRILRNMREIQYVVLTCISTMAQERPAMFRPYLQDFFVKGTDPIFNRYANVQCCVYSYALSILFAFRLLKLEVLAAIATKDNVQAILKELQSYARHGNQSFVCATVRAVGRVADALPNIADHCMEGILHLLDCNKTAEVSSAAVVVLRQMMQQNGMSEIGARILHRLAKMLVTDSGLDDPAARASVVWLVGEFHDTLRPVAADLLRLLAVGFPDEETCTRMQILNLALKLSVLMPDDDNVQALMTYVLEMARYDTDTDLRDRSRFLTALMGLAPGGETGVIDEEALEELAEHAKALVLAPKLPPMTLLGPVDVEGMPNFTVGSLSSLVGHRATGYDPIPAWPEVQPDLGVRDAHRHADDDEDNLTTVGGSGTDKASVPSKFRNDSSSDDDERDVAPKEFYAGHSSSSSEDEESDDEEESDDDDDDDADESEEEETESEEESESESEEESATRIPINYAQKNTQPLSSAPVAVRAGGIRKVTHKSGSLGADVSASIIDMDHLTSQFTSGTQLAQPSLSDLLHTPSVTTTNPSLLLEEVSTSYSSAQFPSLAQTQIKSSPTDQDVLSDIMESFGRSSSLANSGASNVMSGSIPSAALSASGNADNSAYSDLASLDYRPTYKIKSNPSAGFSPASSVEILSEPRVILRAEISGGLALSLCFRYGVRPTQLPGANCAFLILKNAGEQPIRYA